MPAEGELLVAAAWRRRRVLEEPATAHGQRILGEPHLEGVLAAREAEPAYVLAGCAGCAVLEAVAEEERIPARSRVSKSSSATITPVSWCQRTRPVRQFSRARTAACSGRSQGRRGGRPHSGPHCL